MHKVILFISSYIPLYVLLIVKNILERCTEGGKFLDIFGKLESARFFDEINDWAILILALLSLASFVYLWRKLKNTKSEKCYEVQEVRDETSNNYFNYISVYLLSCIGLSLNNIVDVFVLAFLMIIVGYIYITNDLIYLNPMLSMMGYKVYYTKLRAQATLEEIEGIVISKNCVDMDRGRKYSLIVSNKNWGR